MGTRRQVSPADKARFFQAIAAGSSILDASRIAGIHVNTGCKWLKKSKLVQAKREEAELVLGKHYRNQGGVQRDLDADMLEAAELPPAVPLDRLSEDAKRGLVDFDFFRKHYLGRVPSPWQVEAAVTLVELLESDRGLVSRRCFTMWLFGR